MIEFEINTGKELPRKQVNYKEDAICCSVGTSCTVGKNAKDWCD